MSRSRIETDQQYEQKNSVFEYGRTSGTTDNSGSLVITHSLSTAPTTVIANSVFLGASVSTSQYSITVVNMNASGSTLRFYGTGSSFAASANVTASWAAWV
jgi:hypothetical protein